MKAHIFSLICVTLLCVGVSVNAALIFEEEFNYEQGTQLINNCWSMDPDAKSMPFTVKDGALYVNDISEQTYQSAVYDLDAPLYRGDFQEARFLIQTDNSIYGNWYITLKGEQEQSIMGANGIGLLIGVNAGLDGEFCENQLIFKMIMDDKDAGIQKYYNIKIVPIDLTTAKEVRVVAGDDGYCRVFVKNNAFWSLIYISAYPDQEKIKEFNSCRINTTQELLAGGMVYRIRLYDAYERIKGTILSVPQQYSTIEDAVNSAHYGDTIIIAQGEYEGATLIPGLHVLGSGADSTKINGSLTVASDCTIANISVVRGEITIPESNEAISIKRIVSRDGMEYGIRAYDNTDFVIENCKIVNHGYLD